MIDELTAGGFRLLLEKALRRDEVVDWSPHAVDYSQFKSRLRAFAQRRAQIRNMLHESPDQKIDEVALYEIIGPKTPFPSPLAKSCTDGKKDHAAAVPAPHRGPLPTDEATATIATTEGYIPFDEIAVDYSGESSDADSFSSSGSLKKRRKNKRSIMRRLSNAERNELMLFLAQESDKAHAFYLAQWQKLSQQLDSETQRKSDTTRGVLVEEAFSSSSPDGDDATEELGREILELFAFCLVTIITQHQILIRYDAFARAFEGTPMRSFYLKRVKQKNTAFRSILLHQELDMIADSYVQQHQLQKSNTEEEDPYLTQFTAQRGMFADILTALDNSDYATGASSPTTPVAAFLSKTNNERLKDSMVSFWKMSMIGMFEGRLGLEPAYLTGRGKSLTKEMEQLVMWRKQKHTRQQKKTEKKLTGMQTYHLTLNLLSAFLYCMNYYIVEPSSTMYVNRLGALDTMSGTLIGMLPLAAFCSSIPYSMWTNRSFRHPLLMSCFMLVVGNLLYR